MSEANKQTQSLPVLDGKLTVLEHNQRTWDAYQQTMKREHRKSDLLFVAAWVVALAMLTAGGLLLARWLR